MTDRKRAAEDPLLEPRGREANEGEEKGGEEADVGDEYQSDADQLSESQPSESSLPHSTDSHSMEDVESIPSTPSGLSSSGKKEKEKEKEKKKKKPKKKKGKSEDGISSIRKKKKKKVDMFVSSPALLALSENAASFEATSFEEAFQSDAVRHDPLAAKLINIPSDDIIVETFPKVHRTEAATKPNCKLSKLEPHVQESFRVFSSDWRVVRRRYTEYTRVSPAEGIASLPKETYEINERQKAQESGSKIKKSKEDAKKEKLLLQHLKHPPPEIHELNRQERRKDRLPLFHYYDPGYEWPNHEKTLCERVMPERIQLLPKAACQFTLQIKHIAFVLGEIEPFFCYLALYDVGQRVKLSENFHFDQNSEKLMSYLGKHMQESDPLTRAQKALFTVTKRSPDIYLVLQVEKVLQGDADALDPYMKVDLRGRELEKRRTKVEQGVLGFCKRLGAYRQLFAWGAIPVFDRNNALMLTEETEFDALYPAHCKDNIFDLLAELRDPKTKKQRQTVPGFCKVSVRSLTAEQVATLPNLVDPSLSPVIQDMKAETLKEEEPSALSGTDSARHKVVQDYNGFIREVQEFPVSPIMQPHWSYVNNFYIYPESLVMSSHNRKVKTIAIKIQLKSNDLLSEEGLMSIYGKSSCPTASKEAYAHVTYHTKTPQFHDEIKIRLPTRLTQKHHFLFTFYHISCAQPKKGEDVVEVPVGHAILPLYNENKIVENNQGDHHTLPIIISGLQDNYLAAKHQYLDNGKPYFRLRMKVVSTVYPEDTYLNNFFQTYHRSDYSDSQLGEAIDGLEKISPVLAIQYLPVILNQLFDVMCTHPKTAGNHAFKALIKILNKVHSETREDANMRSPILSACVTYAVEAKQPQLYIALSTQLLTLIAGKNMREHADVSTKDLASVVWFVFEVVIKSMVTKLQHEGQLGSPDRKEWFSSDFSRLLTKMISFLVKYYKQHINADDYKPAMELNKVVALFIRDLFPIFDRGRINTLVETYVQAMSSAEGDDKSMEMEISVFKFDFFKILTDHEHFVPVNLPLSYDILPEHRRHSLFDVISQKHPISSMLVREVIASVMTNTNSLSRSMAICTLNLLLTKHDYDARYQSPEERERVAVIYFPLLVLLVDYYSRLGAWKSGQEKRAFFISFLWILKGCRRSFLRGWWSKESPAKRLTFLELLMDCIDCFEYDPKTYKGILLAPSFAFGKKKENKAERGPVTRTSVLIEDDSVDTDKESKLVSEVNKLVLDVLEDYIEDFASELCAVTPDGSVTATPRDLNRSKGLSAANRMIALSSPSSIGDQPMMDKVFALLIRFFQKEQSQSFLHCLFATMRSFVARFRSILFAEGNSYLYSLCREVLRHCSFSIAPIRCEATSLFFLLMRHNYQEVGNFGRVYTQATTALSKLITDGLLTEDKYIKRALAALNEYALHLYSKSDLILESSIPARNEEVHSYLKANFARQVEEISGTLTKILRDTIQVNELKQKADSEMIADLYYRIAQGYIHTPDLRITWLGELARFHDQEKNFMEAALCHIHVAALVLEYLKQKDPEYKLHVHNEEIFQKLCPGLSEIADEDEEGGFQSHFFTEKGLIISLKLALDLLEKAQAFEFGSELYKLLLSIYEKNASYKDLATCHHQLDKFYSAIAKGDAGSRLEREYFRVGFYGRTFGRLDSKHFIYKEPQFTHLFDFTERMKELVKKTYGVTSVEVLDAHEVDRSNLKEGTCYLQITYLKPYFQGDSLPRNTTLEKATNLSTFVFQTPFTKDGQPRGTVAQQYKRKTMLTVDGQFPSILRRLPVKSYRQEELNPLEVSIEEIDNRTAILVSELVQQPPNIKTLQHVLQGSALPQVNQGAIEICNAFLGGGEGDKYPPELVEKLRESLRQFLKSCKRALQLNKTLIGGEQSTFQEEMEIGFNDLQKQMSVHLQRKYYFSSSSYGVSPVNVEEEVGAASASSTADTSGSKEASEDVTKGEVTRDQQKADGLDTSLSRSTTTVTNNTGAEERAVEKDSHTSQEEPDTADKDKEKDKTKKKEERAGKKHKGEKEEADGDKGERRTTGSTIELRLPSTAAGSRRDWRKSAEMRVRGSQGDLLGEFNKKAASATTAIDLRLLSARGPASTTRLPNIPGRSSEGNHPASSSSTEIRILSARGPRDHARDDILRTSDEIRLSIPSATTRGRRANSQSGSERPHPSATAVPPKSPRRATTQRDDQLMPPPSRKSLNSATLPVKLRSPRSAASAPSSSHSISSVKPSIAKLQTVMFEPPSPRSSSSNKTLRSGEQQEHSKEREEAQEQKDEKTEKEEKAGSELEETKEVKANERKEELQTIPHEDAEHRTGTTTELQHAHSIHSKEEKAQSSMDSCSDKDDASDDSSSSSGEEDSSD
ncbi:Dedicator of cytokinesis protein 6 [Balamuthia mandrillaris]